MNYEVPIKYTFEAAKCIAESNNSLERYLALPVRKVEIYATDPGANGVLFIL